VSDERRQFQRLTLTEPLDGWFGDYAIRLADVSATGALIEHDDAIDPESRGLLRFFWRGTEVEILAETVRRDDHHTGIHFLEESETLRQLIAVSATEMLLALEANARGDRQANIVGEETITSAWAAKSIGYVQWTLTPSGAWKSQRSLLPDQPENGFTIAAGEAAEQVALLRSTYESGNEESRRLTRMLAELSVAAGASFDPQA
jgi:hypothetical protein